MPVPREHSRELLQKVLEATGPPNSPAAAKMRRSTSEMADAVADLPPSTRRAVIAAIASPLSIAQITAARKEEEQSAIKAFRESVWAQANP